MYMPDYSIEQMMEKYLSTPYDQPKISISQGGQINVINCVDQFTPTDDAFNWFCVNNGFGCNKLQLTTGLDYDSIGQQSFTQINDLFNYIDPTYICLGSSIIRHTGTLYDNECEISRMIIGHIMPMILDNNTIIRGSDIPIKTGTWINAVNGTDPIDKSIYTSTQNDYVQFTSGNTRYLGFNFDVIPSQLIDWTIRINGQDMLRVVSTGLTNIANGYFIGVVIDTRNTNNKTVRIINNKATSAEKQYINFVAGWNSNNKQCCLINPPRFNWFYNNSAPYNSGNLFLHTNLLENALIDVSRTCQSHNLNVSFYKFYAQSMNLFNDNQIQIALYGQKRLGKEINNTIQ